MNFPRYRGLRPITLCAWLTLAVPCAAADAPVSPFLSAHAYASTDLSAFTKWASVLPRYNAEHAAPPACAEEDCPSQQWERLLLSLRGKSMSVKLDKINHFFNQFPYIEDQENYAVEDYWATPYELMRKGGDCEDYAIAKYISLRRMGVDEGTLRIVILQDMNRGGILHAVLEVNVEGVPYILDNQVQEVTPAAKVFHYRPIYAINAVKWWAFR